MSNSSFTWSPDKQRVVVWTAVVPTIFSLVSAIVVLALALVVWRSPKTRPPPGRQTLRMLLWVQLMSLAYSGTYLGEVLITGPTKWCDAIIIIALFSNNFINFMIRLIPLHLQLVLVHSVRTDGFVHWYLVISLAASTMTALPGCITRIWGWDPETLICWISATNPRSRTAWEVGASYAWFVISTAVASVSTIVVLAHLVKHARSKVVRCEVTLGNSVSAGNANASSRRRHRGTSVGGNASIARRAAWRILFYPVVLGASRFTPVILLFSSSASQSLITKAHSRRQYHSRRGGLPRHARRWDQRIRDIRCLGRERGYVRVPTGGVCSYHFVHRSFFLFGPAHAFRLAEARVSGLTRNGFQSAPHLTATTLNAPANLAGNGGRASGGHQKW